MRRRESLKVNAELNLINIIDVIFAILVVFMITAPLATRGVKVDLPQTQAGGIEEKKAIEITLTREREILIDAAATTNRDFEQDFRAVFTGDPETAILINADRTVPYGMVVEVIAAVQRQGGKRLGFLTDRPTLATAPAEAASVEGRR
jgi:biopolymer transport protein ExbD/biopolymer transport protein TolR